MTSLLEMVRLKYLERKDSLMFTYLGDGRFDTVIFDKTKVQKIYHDSEATTGSIYVAYIIIIILSLASFICFRLGDPLFNIFCTYFKVKNKCIWMYKFLRMLKSM